MFPDPYLRAINNIWAQHLFSITSLNLVLGRLFIRHVVAGTIPSVVLSVCIFIPIPQSF